MRENGKFQKGHKGFKPIGATSSINKVGKELILNVIENEAENMKAVLDTIREQNPVEYMKIMSKLFTYIIPKQNNIDLEVNNKPTLIIDWSEMSDSTLREIAEKSNGVDFIHPIQVDNQ